MDKEKNHKESINHINRLTGQLSALKETISQDNSCSQISTEMFSILQSTKGLARKIAAKSMENEIFQKSLKELESKKLLKMLKQIS